STANTGPLPSTISVQLTWDTVLQGQMNYSTAGFSPGDVLVVAQQAASAAATGRHTWSLHVFSNGVFDQTRAGVTHVVAQDTRPFGAGWTFAPVDQLINIPQDAN